MVNLKNNWKHIVNASVTKAVNDRVYGLSLSKERHKWEKIPLVSIFSTKLYWKKVLK